MSVRNATSVEDMRAFFDLHLRTRKLKHGLLAQPWPFFEMIWERLLATGAGVLVVAELEGEIVAGVVFLRWKDTLYYKFNASNVEALDQRPNDAIMSEGIQLAHDNGDRWLDIGVSDVDQPGLIRYKEKLRYRVRNGANLEALARFGLACLGSVRSASGRHWVAHRPVHARQRHAERRRSAVSVLRPTRGVGRRSLGSVGSSRGVGFHEDAHLGPAVPRSRRRGSRRW